MGLPSSRARQRFGDRVHDRFEQSVRLPSIVSLGLAGVIGFAGIAFMSVGVGMFVMSLSSSTPLPHPVGAPLVALMMAAMGYAFLYVGWRLLKARKATDRLFGFRGRLVFCICVGISAVGMVWNFVVAPGFGIGCLALITGYSACALFYSTLSQRQAARDAIRKPPVHLPSRG